MSAGYAIGRVPAIHAGPGELDRLSALIGATTEVLLVYDAGLATGGLPSRVRSVLGKGASVHQFVAPNGEPTVETVNAAARVARALDTPTVIGLGGGTPLDIAKLAAGLYERDTGVEPFLLGADTLTQRTPLIAIPTTAGTGSEVTRTCVLSDSTGRKLWVWSDALLPDAVILDPTLTTGLPPRLTLSTGLDAFTHALEACTGQRRNRINEACSLQAIRLILSALERVIRVPDDLEARQRMQEGALLGGMAIDSGGTGLAHTVGHALGSLYHLPHGIAVALGLQASLPWSVAGDAERYRAVAKIVDGAMAPAQLSGVYAEWLEKLGFAAVVGAIGSRDLDPKRLAEAMLAEENRPMSRNNARVPTSQDIHTVAVRVCELLTSHHANSQASA